MEDTVAVVVPQVIQWGNIITSDTFQPLITGIMNLVPTILGFSLTLAGIRLGLRWVNGAVGGRRKG